MIKIASIKNNNIESAADELNQQLNPKSSDLVMYFASSSYDSNNLASAMNNAFDCETVGCTTSGELISGKMLDDSIVAMCLDNEVVEDYCVQVIENLSVGLNSKIDESFLAFEKHFKQSISDIDPNDYVGLILTDGLSNKEETINDLIGNKSNLIFVGGSAGDDLKFKKTLLYHNDNAYTHASILVLLKPKNGYDILKTQSFNSIGKQLTVTKTIEEERRVVEFNNKPAAEAYAEVLQCDKDALGDKLFQNPLGMMYNKENIFVRSPRVVEKEDVLFYCSIKEGQELEVLESTDIVSETKSALDETSSKNGTPSAIINFNCILRKLELESKEQGEAYGNLFRDVPTIGFHTYGESYIGHINQTATMLVLK